MVYDLEKRAAALESIIEDSYVDSSIRSKRYDIRSLEIYDYHNMMLREDVCLPYEQRELVWTNKQNERFITSVLNEEPVGALYSWECGNNYSRLDMRTYITNEVPENKPKFLNFDGRQRGACISAIFGKGSQGLPRKRIDLNVRTKKVSVVNPNKKISKRNQHFTFKDIGSHMCKDSGSFNLVVKAFLANLKDTEGIFKLTEERFRGYRDFIWKFYWIRSAQLYNIVLDSSWNRHDIDKKFREINDNLVKVSTLAKARSVLINQSDGSEQCIEAFVVQMSPKVEHMLTLDIDLVRGSLQRVFLYSLGQSNSYKVTSVATLNYFREKLKEGTNSILFHRLATSVLNEDLISIYMDVMYDLGCYNNHRKFSITDKLKEGIFSLIILAKYVFNLKKENDVRKLTRALSRLAFAANINVPIGGDVDTMYKLWTKLFNTYKNNNNIEGMLNFIYKEAIKLYEDVDIELGLRSQENSFRFYRAMLYNLSSSGAKVFMGRDSISTYVRDNLSSTKTRVDGDHLQAKNLLILAGIENHTCAANLTPMAPSLNRSKQDDPPSVYYPKFMGTGESSDVLSVKRCFTEEEEDLMLHSHGLWRGWHEVAIKDYAAFIDTRASLLKKLFDKKMYDF